MSFARLLVAGGLHRYSRAHPGYLWVTYIYPITTNGLQHVSRTHSRHLWPWPLLSFKSAEILRCFLSFSGPNSRRILSIWISENVALSRCKYASCIVLKDWLESVWIGWGAMTYLCRSMLRYPTSVLYGAAIKSRKSPGFPLIPSKWLPPTPLTPIPSKQKIMSVIFWV